MINQSQYFKRFLGISQDLDYLADALYTCGNSKLGDTLGNISSNLRATAQQFEADLHEELHADYQQTMGNIGKTLNVLLNLEDPDGTVQLEA